MGSSFKSYIKVYLPGVLTALGDPKVQYDVFKIYTYYTIPNNFKIYFNYLLHKTYFRHLNVKVLVNVCILGQMYVGIENFLEVIYFWKHQKTIQLHFDQSYGCGLLKNCLSV